MSNSDIICRACLANMGSCNYNLFENVSAHMFWFCTSIQVLENEPISKALCSTCYELLVKFAEFKQKCIESQSSLVDLKTVKIESSYDVPSLGYEDSNDYKKENDADSIISDDMFKYEFMIDNADHNGSSGDDLKPKQDYIQQINTESIVEEFSLCEICNKTFETKKKLKHHMRTHKSNIFSCSLCNKIYHTKQGLKKHKENNHLRQSLNDTQCRSCGKIFKTKDTCKKHERQHDVTKPNYICDVCGKIYQSKTYLETHIEIHHKEHKYNCEQCNKTFCSKAYLQSHCIRTHTGRKYICQICNFCYKYKNNLVKHLLTHEGKKLYKCEECNKSFTTRTYCKEHKRLHTGERPFSCLYCPKAFMNKRHLTDHHRIHTGERKHKCTVCEQNFTQRGTLKRHMKIHNKISSAI